jgi:O-antigen/teichoic acid export membrane protein
VALSRSYRTIGAISVLSVVGIVATFVFQVLAARSLTVGEFAIFAAFLSLVNIAAVGSSALQNAVAVNTAKAGTPAVLPESHFNADGASRNDGSFIESVSFGLLGALGAWSLTLDAGNILHGNAGMIIAALFTIPVSFAFARQLGFLQGNERSQSVVAWTTIATAIRLGMFAILMLASAEPLFAVTAAVVVSIVASSIGSAFANRKSILRPRNLPFTNSTVVVLMSTIGFAWMTNADVLFVSSSLTTTAASHYAVASVIIKTTLIVPGTLSLIFLARFAKSRDAERQRGEFAIEIISLASIVLLASFLFMFGTPLIVMIFGDTYTISATYLLTLSLCFAPWVYLQAILIRANSLARWGTAIPIIVGAVVQALIFSLTLPDLTMMLLSNAVLGVGLCLWVKFSVGKTRRTTR